MGMCGVHESRPQPEEDYNLDSGLNADKSTGHVSLSYTSLIVTVVLP